MKNFTMSSYVFKKDTIPYPNRSTARSKDTSSKTLLLPFSFSALGMFLQNSMRETERSLIQSSDTQQTSKRT